LHPGYIQRVVLTRIPARQDSIDRPWSIDPISEAVRFGRLRTGFGELDGRNIIPVKFAEAFGFGRENSTGMSNLVLSSPDGESGRPVGKVECLGNPKGKLVGVPFLLVTFLWACKEKQLASKAK